LFSCPAKKTRAMRAACSLVTVVATQVTDNQAPEFLFSHSSLKMQRTAVVNRHMYEKANQLLVHLRLRWGPLSAFARVTTCLLRDKYWGYCVHNQNMWFYPVALPALSPLLFAAQVVCRPCLATSELKVAFAFPIECLVTSPILLLMRVHQGQIARPPCKLMKSRTTTTTRHCLMFALPYCIDLANIVHCIFF